MSRRLAVACLCAVASAGLRDIPIAGSAPPQDLPLWLASEATLGLQVPAAVPGDIITALERARVIGDPYYELNLLDNRTLWDVTATAWRWTTPLPPAAPAPSTRLLVLEGVKMGARVSADGVALGNATNQFLRYIYPLPPNASSVEVAFDSSLPLAGRFMPCSGFWDWAPDSNLTRNDSEFGVATTFSSGVVGAAYIASVAPGSLALIDVVPLVQYRGAYPVGALVDGAHAGFVVNVTAHAWAPAGGATGTFALTTAWGGGASSPVVAAPAGDSSVTLSIAVPATAVSLWWPNGAGAQPLYNLTVTWTPAGGAPAVATASTRRIGFRVVALVTVNDTNASYVAENADADGSGTFGMFYRVNGLAVWARGADFVPMEELEGRQDARAYATLVRSAASAHFNFLRVWGGGSYPPDAFFDACDEAGVLLYFDMQFAGGGHDLATAVTPLSAASNASIAAEVVHQVRRLAAHPCVAMYDGANEVIVQRSGPSARYTSMVMAVVAREDPTRIVWPASPAAGWLSGVNRLFGTPNGEPLVPLVPPGSHIWACGNERHGPYTAGVGAAPWQTIMRDPWSSAQSFAPDMPLSYLAGPPAAGAPAGGVGAPSTFISEFGAVSMSSFEAMSASLAPASYGLHGGGVPVNCTPTAGTFLNRCTGRNAMAQRNWPCDSLVWSYFGPALLNASGAAAFRGALFQCQLAGALDLQQNIEARRSRNELGHLIWQLNDIWASGSWGLLEYGGAGAAGVLAGGRWKPALNWLRSYLFADVFAACGFVGRAQRDFVCYVNNAGGAPFAGALTLLAADLAAAAARAPPRVLATMAVAVPAGPGALAWLAPNISALPNASATILIARLAGAGGAILAERMLHITPPRNLAVARATVAAAVAPRANADGSVNISLATDVVALFVSLTSAAPGAFDENALLLLPTAPRVVRWLPFDAGGAPGDAALLAATLRVEDHSMYALA